MLQSDRADPTVIHYHRIDGGEVETCALVDIRAHVLFFQPLPQLRPRFPQVGLRHVEHPEHLHTEVDVVLLFLFGGEFLVIVILNFFLCLLVYAGKRWEHDGKRLLAAQHRYTRPLLALFFGHVHPLYAVERAEARDRVALPLAVQQ